RRPPRTHSLDPLPLHAALPISNLDCVCRPAGESCGAPADRGAAEEWTTGDFAKDAPNATVSVLSKDGVSARDVVVEVRTPHLEGDRKSTRLNSSHQISSYAVFC